MILQKKQESFMYEYLISGISAGQYWALLVLTSLLFSFESNVFSNSVLFSRPLLCKVLSDHRVVVVVLFSPHVHPTDEKLKMDLTGLCPQLRQNVYDEDSFHLHVAFCFRARG